MVTISSLVSLRIVVVILKNVYFLLGGLFPPNWSFPLPVWFEAYIFPAGGSFPQVSGNPYSVLSVAFGGPESCWEALLMCGACWRWDHWRVVWLDHFTGLIFSLEDDCLAPWVLPWTPLWMYMFFITQCSTVLCVPPVKTFHPSKEAPDSCWVEEGQLSGWGI